MYSKTELRKIPYRTAWNVINEHSGYSCRYGVEFSKDMIDWINDWYGMTVIIEKFPEDVIVREDY